MAFPKPIEERASKPTQSLELLERALELLERLFELTNTRRISRRVYFLQSGTNAQRIEK